MADNPATDIQKGSSIAYKMFIAMISIGLIILLIIGVRYAWDYLPKVGTDATQTPVNAPTFVETPLRLILGISDATLTWEILIIYLAIFIMLLFALADIIELFSTFSEVTAWVLAFCLATVAGVTKVTTWIATIMGFTAGVGALGIAAIIAAAVFFAVITNWGIGGFLRKWRLERQIEIESFKSTKGAAKVTEAIKGLKEVQSAFKSGEVK